MTRIHAFTHAQMAHDENRILCGTGTSVPFRTTFQESPRGAESSRDTGDVQLGKAMARRVTPIPSGCHSPEPRAVRTTNKVADRCTSIAPDSHSRKHEDSSPSRVNQVIQLADGMHH
jgi:hypothetical protein